MFVKSSKSKSSKLCVYMTNNMTTYIAAHAAAGHAVVAAIPAGHLGARVAGLLRAELVGNHAVIPDHLSVDLGIILLLCFFYRCKRN